jgi:hypothetical protein
MTCSGLRAQAAHNSDPQQSCRKFVKDFYDWYIPKSPKEFSSPDRAMKRRKDAFSSVLLQRLREDFEAQAKVAGEIVGLDSDPFLNC